ncbi:glycine cleavage system aminomethyltransferase GcvT [Gryllotalpicola ginsengisoli]|uniref:glycine cleavage system aminomethyltransferase GcvT n=1 Tax=Gryllotalpicola ginsengisoli TaxID=444608 RepID=UPI0003B4B05B|nr:glycine cleavage system aminomethyltransferase GcvT [Gryllotalpicola ginsengisoli]
MSDRLSPLHEVHAAAGAVFTDFAGWQMPVRYSSDLAEHKAVREAAGIFDLSHMGEILVVGPGAAAALDYAVSGRISALQPGQAKYTLLLNDAGGVLDDLIVYRTGEDRFLVVANAANAGTVAGELRGRADRFDAQVHDESDDVALIAVQGPRALEVLLNTEGFALDGGHPDGEDVADALSSLRYYRALAGNFNGSAVLFARTGYTGEDGFEIFVSPDAARALWGALVEAGAPFHLVPAGLAARDTLRLEAGMPLYGHELDAETLPVQAGLGRVVDLGKPGDFVGRAAIEKGPAPEASVLVGLRGEGKRAARADYPVRDESGATIGRVTSGALSPTLGFPIAMAYVAPSHAAEGTVVAVDIRGTAHPYLVTPLPFYKRKKTS